MGPGARTIFDNISHFETFLEEVGEMESHGNETSMISEANVSVILAATTVFQGANDPIATELRQMRKNITSKRKEFIQH